VNVKGRKESKQDKGEEESEKTPKKSALARSKRKGGRPTNCHRIPTRSAGLKDNKRRLLSIKKGLLKKGKGKSKVSEDSKSPRKVSRRTGGGPQNSCERKRRFWSVKSRGKKKSAKISTAKWGRRRPYAVGGGRWMLLVPQVGAVSRSEKYIVEVKAQGRKKRVAGRTQFQIRGQKKAFCT